MSEKLEAVEDVREIKVQRPKRVKLTAEESLGRMELGQSSRRMAEGGTQANRLL